jgi:hypothetical protein
MRKLLKFLTVVLAIFYFSFALSVYIIGFRHAMDDNFSMKMILDALIYHGGFGTLLLLIGALILKRPGIAGWVTLACFLPLLPIDNTRRPENILASVIILIQILVFHSRSGKAEPQPEQPKTESA